MTANVTATAPAGFQVSTAPAGPFATAITLAPAVVNAGTQVYVVMPANTAGNYSGSVVFKSSGAATHSVAVQGVVNPPKTAAIIPQPTSLSKFAATSPNPSSSKSFSVTTVSINESIIVTAPINFQVAIARDGFGNAVTLPAKGGAVNVRIAPGSAAGPVSGNVALQSGTNSASVSLSGKVSGQPTPAPSPTPKPSPSPTPPPPSTLSFTPATLTLPFTTFGSPSAVGSFTVNGGNLSGPVVVQGDNANFQLSLSESGPFSDDSVTLTPVSGNLAGVRVYVRTTGSALGSFTDDIVGIFGGLAYAYGTVNGTVGPSQQQSLALVPASLGGFQTTQGTPSAYQLMELKGSGFASKTAIAVDALPGFQISRKSSGGWGKSITIYSSQLPAPVYLRLSGNQPGFLPGYNYNGNVSAYGGGATASAAVSGNTYPAINLGISATKLAGFAATAGTSSASQKVLFGPLNPCFYTGPITIIAPAKYEISTDGVNYTTSISYPVLPGVNGTQWVDDLFIRISAKAAKGTANGTVTLNTPNLPSSNPSPLKISVSGSVK